MQACWQRARGLVGDGSVTPRKPAAFAAQVRTRETALGRPLNEREQLAELADVAARFAGKWASERRARRLLIANGTGCYRGNCSWNLDRDFPTLDNLWES
jgi:hypothetical protein